MHGAMCITVTRGYRFFVYGRRSLFSRTCTFAGPFLTAMPLMWLRASISLFARFTIRPFFVYRSWIFCFSGMLPTRNILVMTFFAWAFFFWCSSRKTLDRDEQRIGLVIAYAIWERRRGLVFWHLLYRIDWIVNEGLRFCYFVMA